jgi:hypothetical protein
MPQLRNNASTGRDGTGQGVGTASADELYEGTAPPPPSLWLYLAGLCVTLSGLYAVNFGSQDQNFTLLTVGLAVCGYLVSYVLRLRRISMQSLQTPILVILGLTLLAMLSSERGLSWLAPLGEEGDRGRILQFIFAWLAIIHSFVLANDAAVLFACVPCMTMLALVSTRNPDPEIQNAFLAFIAGSTFMMVHENYLRTRQAQLKGRSSGAGRRLFGGQLQLTALCLIGALFLANFVAVPIRSIGQTLFDAGMIPQNNNKITQVQKIINAGQSASEQNEIDLGGGPVNDTNTPIMSIKSPRPLNWRGKTFAVYTGSKFINLDAQTPSVSLRPLDENGSGSQPETNQFTSGDAPTFQSDVHAFRVPPIPIEMAGVDLANRDLVSQSVTVLANNSVQIYGAASINKISGHFDTLTESLDGTIMPPLAVPQNASYDVASSVPKSDPQLLRSVSSAPEDIPEPIRKVYLETQVWQPATNSWQPESATLRSIVDQVTHGIPNHYDRARAIENYISSTCMYTLRQERTPVGKDVVEYFLTVEKKGYCIAFAAAMTMLARYAGIPARMASGYLSGDPQENGTLLVRDKHKHVWAELYFPRVGWVPFDATENAAVVPDDAVKGRDRTNSFLAWFFSHGWLPPVTGLMILGLFVYLVKTELLDRLHWTRIRQRTLQDFPPTNAAIITAYLAGCDLLRRRGLPRPEYQTANEYAVHIRERATDRAGAVGDIWDELTALFMQCRYGTSVATSDDVQAANEALVRLRSALSVLPRGVLAGDPVRARA